MADTFTAVLNLTKPEVGASTDTWGTKVNADLDTIDGLFDAGPVLKLSKGGTGAATAAGARTNLGLGSDATGSNLSALTNAATARTNLGLAIGTDVQAYAAGLTTWAGKTAPSGIVVGTSDTQTLSNKTFSGAQTFGSAPLAAPSGSAPLYLCRAWVNFNGTGTVAIRASGNVSSITDNATGLYTVNFTTSMPDTNYAVVGSAGLGSAIVTRLPAPGSTVTASSVQVDSTDTAQSVRVDISSYSVAILR